MKEIIEIKRRMKTMLYCLFAMGIVGIIIIFIDKELHQHIYLLIAPFILGLGCTIGALIIYLKLNKKPCINR